MEDLTGQKFGWLTAIEWTGKRENGSRDPIWLFRCECGQVVERASQKAKKAVRKGRTPCCKRYECMKKAYPRLRQPAALNALIAQYRYDARKRDMEFSLSHDECEALFGGDCFYCGALPAQVKHGGREMFTYNGIDRLDNEQGYVTGNVVPCCGACNKAKRAMSANEFIELATRIANRHSDVGNH